MKWLKNAFTKMTSKLPKKKEGAADEKPSGPSQEDAESRGARLAWPPKLTGPPKILGEVKDVSGRQYARDIGRSFSLGGRLYYVYGDTFCFDDKGEFLGVTNNSLALIPDRRNPTRSKYLSPNAKVPEFVPFSADQKQFNDNPENIAEMKRIVNWSFGGIITKPGTFDREGWLFFDPVECHGADAVQSFGVGVAKARAIGPDGSIECERVGDFPLFPPDGPLWGNMSNIAAPDGYTYLLSGMNLDNFMARIRTDADFSVRSNYQFLKRSGEWSSTYSGPFGPFGELAYDVLAGQGQGAILYVPEFAPRGKPYLWFGCEKFLTSQLCVGCAPRPEGPWDVHKLGAMPALTEYARNRYCIYPHLWGSDFRQGKILITWSDDGTLGGKVGAAIFTFALDWSDWGYIMVSNVSSATLNEDPSEVVC